MKVLRATLNERMRLAEQEGQFSQSVRIPLTLGGDINVDLVPETGTITGPSGNRIGGRQFVEILNRLGTVNAELTQTGPLTATLNTGQQQYRLDYEKAPSIPGWQREEAPEEPQQPAARPPRAPKHGSVKSRMANAIAHVSGLRLALRSDPQGSREIAGAVDAALENLRRAYNVLEPTAPPEPSPPRKRKPKRKRGFFGLGR
ncbi:hypothetical protein LCGC14_0165010 [marine sediment metagenome]|uniref:Uncharacterized protein n=1 Tax=marine sediment metagenome TaxID=412755 RepID=A0A0F9VAT0_9ZZZZ